jgi:hypothetical protein
MYQDCAFLPRRMDTGQYGIHHHKKYHKSMQVLQRKIQQDTAEREETAAYLNFPCGSDAEATSWEPMWLNGTVENDSPASGVCSERLHR